MDYFIDIRLKPDSEMRENVLMNMAYTKLHKVLVNLKSDSIGVSFPEYKIKLGCLLRIHGSKDDLNKLQQLKWLDALVGYCDEGSIQGVPNQTQHRTVSRKRSNMTTSKLNRLIKRGSISSEEVKAYRAKMFANGLDNPFVELISSSTGEKYIRFIEFGDLQDSATSGKFDSFGLSQQATVPWF